MPFTFSHPAAVLPLNYFPKHWFSLTGLVIGSMTPDFEYFIRMKMLSVYGHTWLGLLWFDIPLGLLIMLTYNYLIKNILIDHLPLFLNRRFSGFKNSVNTYKHHFTIILISILIGAASHIAWDSFTHPTGYFVLQIHQLHHRFVILDHPILFYNIIQYLSTIFGGLIIIAVILNLPEGEITIKRPVAYFWLMIFLVAVAVLAVRFYTGLQTDDYINIIITMISGTLIGLIISSLIIFQHLELESNSA